MEKITAHTGHLKSFKNIGLSVLLALLPSREITNTTDAINQQVNHTVSSQSCPPNEKHEVNLHQEFIFPLPHPFEENTSRKVAFTLEDMASLEKILNHLQQSSNKKDALGEILNEALLQKNPSHLNIFILLATEILGIIPESDAKNAFLKETAAKKIWDINKLTELLHQTQNGHAQLEEKIATDLRTMCTMIEVLIKQNEQKPVNLY